METISHKDFPKTMRAQCEPKGFHRWISQALCQVLEIEQ